MINGVEVRKLKIYHDTRGWLTEIYRQDETNYRPVMAYLSETKPGVVRGPHEHKNQSDFFVFLAPGVNPALAKRISRRLSGITPESIARL